MSFLSDGTEPPSPVGPEQVTSIIYRYIAIKVGPSAVHRTLTSLCGHLHSTDTAYNDRDRRRLLSFTLWWKLTGHYRANVHVSGVNYRISHFFPLFFESPDTDVNDSNGHHPCTCALCVLVPNCITVDLPDKVLAHLIFDNHLFFSFLLPMRRMDNEPSIYNELI